MNDPWTWTTVWGLTVEVESGQGGRGKRGKNWDNYNTVTIIFKKEEKGNYRKKFFTLQPIPVQ